MQDKWRTSFYEEYGVIRDVLQNHLTEILTLVAMELPHSISSVEAVLRHKLRLFQALRGLQRASAVVGQYQAYSEQVRRELQKLDSFHSLTPTFAGGPWGWAWGAGLPTSGSNFPNPDSFGWGGGDLQWDFSQGTWQKAFPCLPGLLPARSSRPPAGAVRVKKVLMALASRQPHFSPTSFPRVCHMRLRQTWFLPYRAYPARP
ncbi:hypothetical protein P7K49_015391 [Saguinus oedipus]|uniref:Glucose-6-phosphate dehydrogenase C-terminal domain-containing protein n=1 Tax=Saguinus oedipus TaxID=9490 RepID=A0ABQ9VC05_SAGOE|nr:hypothetical protein P7K49_015391 [Saguinus oedipus]